MKTTIPCLMMILLPIGCGGAEPESYIAPPAVQVPILGTNDAPILVGQFETTAAFDGGQVDGGSSKEVGDELWNWGYPYWTN